MKIASLDPDGGARLSWVFKPWQRCSRTTSATTCGPQDLLKIEVSIY